MRVGERDLFHESASGINRQATTFVDNRQALEPEVAELHIRLA
jgi:hypothetical protein